MSLKERLAEDLKDAMRQGEDVRKSTIRMLRAAITRAEQDKRGKFVEAELKRVGRREDVEIEVPEDEVALDESEVLEVVAKEAKNRRDAIAEYEKGGREDLADQERAELEILKQYLPEQLSREDIRAAAKDVIEEAGATGMGDMGTVMSRLMPRMKGRADGSVVSQIVRELLSGES